MVMMNLCVVALPAIALRNFVMSPLRALLRYFGILRGNITTATANDPAATPADAEVAANEVLPLTRAS